MEEDSDELFDHADVELPLPEQLCELQLDIAEVSRRICRFQSILRERPRPMRSRMPWVARARSKRHNGCVAVRYGSAMRNLCSDLGLPGILRCDKALLAASEEFDIDSPPPMRPAPRKLPVSSRSVVAARMKNSGATTEVNPQSAPFELQCSSFQGTVAIVKDNGCAEEREDEEHFRFVHNEHADASRVQVGTVLGVHSRLYREQERLRRARTRTRQPGVAAAAGPMPSALARNADPAPSRRVSDDDALGARGSVPIVQQGASGGGDESRNHSHCQSSGSSRCSSQGHDEVDYGLGLGPGRKHLWDTLRGDDASIGIDADAFARQAKAKVPMSGEVGNHEVSQNVTDQTLQCATDYGTSAEKHRSTDNCQGTPTSSQDSMSPEQKLHDGHVNDEGARVMRDAVPDGQSLDHRDDCSGYDDEHMEVGAPNRQDNIAIESLDFDLDHCYHSKALGKKASPIRGFASRSRSAKDDSVVSEEKTGVAEHLRVDGERPCVAYEHLVRTVVSHPTDCHEPDSLETASASPVQFSTVTTPKAIRENDEDSKGRMELDMLRQTDAYPYTRDNLHSEHVHSALDVCRLDHDGVSSFSEDVSSKPFQLSPMDLPCIDDAQKNEPAQHEEQGSEANRKQDASQEQSDVMHSFMGSCVGDILDESSSDAMPRQIERCAPVQTGAVGLVEDEHCDGSFQDSPSSSTCSNLEKNIGHFDEQGPPARVSLERASCVSQDELASADQFSTQLELVQRKHVQEQQPREEKDLKRWTGSRLGRAGFDNSYETGSNVTRSYSSTSPCPQQQQQQQELEHEQEKEQEQEQEQEQKQQEQHEQQMQQKELDQQEQQQQQPLQTTSSRWGGSRLGRAGFNKPTSNSGASVVVDPSTSKRGHVHHLSGSELCGDPVAVVRVGNRFHKPGPGATAGAPYADLGSPSQGQLHTSMVDEESGHKEQDDAIFSEDDGPERGDEQQQRERETLVDTAQGSSAMNQRFDQEANDIASSSSVGVGSAPRMQGTPESSDRANDLQTGRQPDQNSSHYYERSNGVHRYNEMNDVSCSSDAAEMRRDYGVASSALEIDCHAETRPDEEMLGIAADVSIPVVGSAAPELPVHLQVLRDETSNAGVITSMFVDAEDGPRDNLPRQDDGTSSEPSRAETSLHVDATVVLREDREAERHADSANASREQIQERVELASEDESSPSMRAPMQPSSVQREPTSSSQVSHEALHRRRSSGSESSVDVDEILRLCGRRLRVVHAPAYSG
eukprot:TRINITY_DN3309_c0_g1_i10.p1 TRINITY_DN3309_c0_g1~~TRINITY_DN3309_c0_g1_i10.p1  ORF type:complete len:1248 (+),score=179.62 TRINITY_DN3309_c0_g1_i10:175-3918(+)